jgi:hypothetical protein
MAHATRDAEDMPYFANRRVLGGIVCVECHGKVAIDLVSDQVYRTCEGIVLHNLKEVKLRQSLDHLWQTLTSPKIIQLSPRFGGSRGTCAVSGKAMISSRSSL